MPSIIVCPSWMPRPQADGYGVHPVDRRLTTETESGNIVRKQFDTDENEADCTLILNPLQSNWFEAFERDMLGQGSVWFHMPLWVGGEIEDHLVRFKTRPKAGNLVGLHTSYSFTLTIAKRELMNEAMVELLYLYGPEWVQNNIKKIATRLHEILHVESPGLTLYDYYRSY